MKTFVCILLFSLGLTGICERANANTHGRKFTHHSSFRLINQQFQDRDFFVADDDDDDQEDLTRKTPVLSNSPASIVKIFQLNYDLHSINVSSAGKHFFYPLTDICIVFHALRI